MKKYLWLSVFAVWLVMCLASPVICRAETYTYDVTGRLTGVTYDDGSSITYTYDNAGNIINQQQQFADGDGDGVSDVDDLCPGTPLFEAVDANGCSATQLDSDNDGVDNAVDQCPATPTGEAVDVNGCSATQLDDDNDGVNNALDLCPATPAGDTVDANGCSVTQLNDVELKQLRCPKKARDCGKDKRIVIVVKNNGTQDETGDVALYKDGVEVSNWSGVTFRLSNGGSTTLYYTYSPTSDGGNTISWTAEASIINDHVPGNNIKSATTNVTLCK